MQRLATSPALRIVSSARSAETHLFNAKRKMATAEMSGRLDAQTISLNSH
jgi:hypothetical protein